MSRNQLDRKFRRTERFALIAMAFIVIVKIAILLFIAWILVALLNHFGATDVNLPGLS